MTLDDLITELREDIVFDKKDPPFASNAQLTRFANHAVDEACERSSMIYDQGITISVIAGTAQYSLPAYVREIDRAKLDLEPNPLRQTTFVQMDERRSGRTNDSWDWLSGANWEKDTGTPVRFIRNDRKLLLIPIPIVADVLRLRVYRIPKTSERMVDSDHVPPIPEQYHKKLLPYMAYLYYSMQDPDVTDPARAQVFLSQFDLAFGRRRSARYDQFNINTPQNARVLPIRMA